MATRWLDDDRLSFTTEATVLLVLILVSALAEGQCCILFTALLYT